MAFLEALDGALRAIAALPATASERKVWGRRAVELYMSVGGLPQAGSSLACPSSVPSLPDQLESILLEIGRRTGADGKVSITRAKSELRSHGARGCAPASQRGKLTKLRNSHAHRDLGIYWDVERLLVADGPGTDGLELHPSPAPSAPGRQPEHHSLTDDELSIYELNYCPDLQPDDGRSVATTIAVTPPSSTASFSSASSPPSPASSAASGGALKLECVAHAGRSRPDDRFWEAAPTHDPFLDIGFGFIQVAPTLGALMPDHPAEGDSCHEAAPTHDPFFDVDFGYIAVAPTGDASMPDHLAQGNGDDEAVLPHDPRFGVDCGCIDNAPGCYETAPIHAPFLDVDFGYIALALTSDALLPDHLEEGDGCYEAALPHDPLFGVYFGYIDIAPTFDALVFGCGDQGPRRRIVAPDCGGVHSASCCPYDPHAAVLGDGRSCLHHN